MSVDILLQEELMISTIVKLCLKSMQEFVRPQTFNWSGFQQIQLDIQFPQTPLKEIAEDEAAIDFLLDELFQEAPASTLEKVPWEQVVAMADQVSKQATIAGLLWKEATTELQALEENMSVYFKMLQGLLLLSHGTKVGAGPTLSSCIHAFAKKVVECSLTFFREAVLSYDSRSLTHIPPLIGTVWEACESLKKTPTTNYTSILRGITQAAVSVKDVVRELKLLQFEQELKDRLKDLRL